MTKMSGQSVTGQILEQTCSEIQGQICTANLNLPCRGPECVTLRRAGSVKVNSSVQKVPLLNFNSLDTDCKVKYV